MPSASRRRWTRRRRSRSGSSTGPSSSRRRRSLATCLEANATDTCVGVIAWMHTFSPAKMWIAGLQALTKPLLHLHTQFNRDLPWGEIDMDFMNLNQAAHGDREFGFIETRLGSPARPSSATGRTRTLPDRIGPWTRAACGLARGPAPQGRPLRRQHAPGRRDRGRQGRGPDPARRGGQRLRRRDLGRRRSGRCPRPRSTASSRPTRRRTTSRPSCAPAARDRDELREAARIEVAPASLPDRRRLRRLHRHVRGPRWAAAAARASPSSG